MFRRVGLAAEASRLQREWVGLWASPSAYRPGDPRPHPHDFTAQNALIALSNLANQHGLTAGDAGILGTAVVRKIDSLRSYADAFDAVMEQISRGELRTVAGAPMGALASPEMVSPILEMAAIAARPEAFAEYGETMAFGSPSTETDTVRDTTDDREEDTPKQSPDISTVRRDSHLPHRRSD
jgi:hypothetical protein